MKRSKLILMVSLIISLTGCSVKEADTFDPAPYIDYCVEKAVTTVESLKGETELPRNILQGQTEWNLVNVHDWCSGFGPGYLWYAYEASKNPAILAKAQEQTESLKEILDVPVANHDLGFMLYCSMGNGLRLTGNEDYKNFLLTTADSLATLYNPTVGTILSWPEMVDKMGWPHNTIIDNMINLELLFWAAKNGGDQRLYDIAVSHATVCMTSLIRPDYTTYHVAVFDTITGDFIKGVTHQGYADDSQWARGQGWGIYGYAMSYRETGNKKFLETSCKLADVFINLLPEDGIPYWDFNDPKIPNSPKDASAAGVAASGMLELSTLVEDEALQQKYYDAAVALLKELSTDKYLSKDTNQAALLHSTGHYPNGSEIDASIIYADYYYLEALLRLKKINEQKNL